MSEDLLPAVDPPVDPEPFNRAYIKKLNDAAKAESEPDPEPEPTEPGPDDPVKAEEPVPPVKVKGEGNPRHDPKARVKEATAEAAEARRLLAESQARIADLERRMAERDAPAAKPEPAPRESFGPLDKEPTEEDCQDRPDPYASYLRASARWEAKQEARQAMAEERAQVAEFTVLQAHKARFDKAIAEDPEFVDLVEAADQALLKAGRPANQIFPPVMLEAIKRSELGPEIARFLGSHPEELVQLAKDVHTAPLSAATAVRRLLEATVKASSPALTAAISTGSAAALPRSSAVPITPVRTSREPAPDKDPSDQPFGSAYIKRMNARERRA